MICVFIIYSPLFNTSTSGTPINPDGGVNAQLYREGCRDITRRHEAIDAL